ncbi:aminopeptidase P family protein, partial [Acinetobacter baumannii]
MMSMLAKDEPSLNPVATRMIVVFQSPRYTHDPHNFSDLAMTMDEGGPIVSVINAVLNGYGTEIERTFFL